jgi:hypothetical protein
VQISKHLVQNILSKSMIATKTILATPWCFGYQKSPIYSICGKYMVETLCHARIGFLSREFFSQQVLFNLV